MNRGLTAVFVVVLGFSGAALSAAPVLAGTHSVPATVRIAGVRVGGLDPAAAASAVRLAFSRPLPLMVGGTRVELHPAKLATAYIGPAVGHARSAPAGTNVHLTVAAHGAAIRSAVAALARRFDHRPRSASLRFAAGRPQIKPAVDGEVLNQTELVARIVHSLTSNVRLPLAVHTKTIVPAVTQNSYGAVVLINRSLNRLTLYRSDNEVWRTFPIATGQAIYPTPAGRFSIIVKWVNPTWYPPTYDAWAKGLKPVPPGPGNPLGTRWMGLSSPGIGIHGTDEPSSIGWNASHGCIRMQVADSEWLFSHVKIGTTVFIV